jgi:TPR repeat protein
MRSSRSVAGVGLAVLFCASAAIAAPTASRAPAAPPAKAAPRAKSTPDTCRSAYDCGAMSAHLAGAENDYPGAFRAIRRGCEIETRAPVEGDSLFACEQYAQLLVNAGTARGGDPAKGIMMLEQMCKARPVSTNGSPSPCSTLAREYDRPPKASGLPRQTDKAAALENAACDQGDAMSCSALGDMLLKGGPGVPADAVKARAAMDRGCAGSDHYAAGICGSIGSMLAEGKLGGAPDRQAAMPYLAKSCAQGYRCDLYVEFLLRDGREDEAVRVFERPRSFPFSKSDLATKYCNEGFTVMCGRGSAPPSAPARPQSAPTTPF